MAPVSSKPVASLSFISAIAAWIVYRQIRSYQSHSNSDPDGFHPTFTKDQLNKHSKRFPPLDNGWQKNHKVAVNKEFFRQLSSIFSVILPSLRTKEVGMLALHSTFLILRTWLSVVVARLDGQIVRHIVAADLKSFLKGMIWWFAIAIPATYTNSMIRYLQSKLSIAFRTRLTRYAHDLYVDDEKAYYKVMNLDGRIENVDQFITTDIAKFCDNLASLFSNLGKPVLDLIIFNYQLATSVGPAGAVALGINYAITASLIRAATPAFGKMAAQEAKLEGDFRTAHSRIITNAEEIAFYHGADLEHDILTRLYKRLVRHLNRVYRIRIAYNMFEDFVIKYCWSAAGLLVSAVPVFQPEWGGSWQRKLQQTSDKEATESNDSDEQRKARRTGAHTQGFITNKRLMIALADAGGRILYSYKELAELAGRTLRVYNLLSVLHAVHQGKAALVKDQVKGTLKKGTDHVSFSNVPVIVPGERQETLVTSMNFVVAQGQHLLVTGANGVGKTGIARLISGLWPIYHGEIERPSDKNIFYIPQRPYLSIGTLRDQIIYPHSYTDMKRAGRTDQDLEVILQIVRLAYLPKREGGFDVIKEWKDVFSGGEKQRMNLARLFYHHPKFAVLDECTSAVSSDMEAPMYEHAKKIGITLITISHRPALYKYHHYLLHLGTGEEGHSWEWTKIGDPEETKEFERELHDLEDKLDELQHARQRLKDIDSELSMQNLA